MQTTPSIAFDTEGEITSNHTDDEFLKMIKKVSIIVNWAMFFRLFFRDNLSHRLRVMNFIYRALRSINPSPYLFYFDFGTYKNFGSSPEAQIVVNPEKAIIYPITGTFRRTGDDEADADLAENF